MIIGLPERTWIWPPITSFNAGPCPLYGTCVMLMPAIWLRYSTVRCTLPPVPEEP